MGRLNENAGAVAGISLTTAGTAVIEVEQDLEGLLNDRMRLATFDVNHEPDPARLMFELRVVQPLRCWWPGSPNLTAIICHMLVYSSLFGDSRLHPETKLNFNSLYSKRCRMQYLI
jgi:hypothetical protein